MDYYQFTSGPSGTSGPPGTSRPTLPFPGPRPFPGSHPRATAGPSSSASASSSSSSKPPRRSRYTMDGIIAESPPAAPLTGDPNFDIIDWHPAYQSCQRYFLDHAQHEPGTQALCALINIRLPFQSLQHPITSSTPPSSNSHNSSPSNFAFNSHLRPPANGLHSPAHSTNGSPSTTTPPTFVSLIPYIRRLIVTGFDKPPILHGFFGDDYARGVTPHLDCERRNYLFAAKHGGWRTCKKHYDGGSGGGGDESVPFMKPLEETRVEEIVAAEKAWSQWLAMEDWMVGPRAPGDEASSGGPGGSSQGSTARGGAVDGMSDRGR